jgi:hypothetical protein
VKADLRLLAQTFERFEVGDLRAPENLRRSLFAFREVLTRFNGILSVAVGRRTMTKRSDDNVLYHYSSPTGLPRAELPVGVSRRLITFSLNLSSRWTTDL